jgi:hypothetical protein
MPSGVYTLTKVTTVKFCLESATWALLHTDAILQLNFSSYVRIFRLMYHDGCYMGGIIHPQ